MIQREKRYVEVDVRFSTEGRLRPLQIIFDKGQVYKIDRIKAIPHNSKCRYGERGAADAVPQLPERCLSRKAGIVRCCLYITLFTVLCPRRI